MLIPETPQDEDSRLAMVRSLEAGAFEDDQVLGRVLELARRCSGAPTAFISLLDETQQHFVARNGLELTTSERSAALCGHAILEPTKVLWVGDARLDPRFSGNPLVVGPPGLRFYAGAPLIVNGRAVGGLCIAGSEPCPRDELVAASLQDLSMIAAARLAARHKHLAAARALEAASDAVVLADENDRYVYWSKGAERLFGYSAAEALGQTGELLGLTGQDMEVVLWGRGEAEGRAALDGTRAEGRARCKDGSYVDVELSLAVWHENGARRISAAIRDISERKAQKERLIRAKIEAEAANVAKTSFLTNMSHELRTPLNGVIGVVELLAETPLTAQQRELTEIIQASSDQLRTLIGDILDLARIEAGELEIDHVDFDLAEELERVRRLCSHRASEKGLDLIFDEGVSRLVTGDPIRLRQVLLNLLTNAIKFTSVGSVTLSVRPKDEDRVVFEVRDTGIGFSDDQRASLFDRFKQADGTITRKFGGTGLGLAICRELVEAMGGVIDCRATPDAGAIFWFEIPLPMGRRVAKAAPFQAGGEERVTHVLVADDHQTNRRVVELMLSSAGIACTSVADGAAAVEACRTACFDLIFMDMMMPRMDGLAATRVIREMEAQNGGARTPIIMLTANTLQEHVEGALRAGADLHLAKPITAAALFEALAVIREAGPQKDFEEARPQAFS